MSESTAPAARDNGEGIRVPTIAGSPLNSPAEPDARREANSLEGTSKVQELISYFTGNSKLVSKGISNLANCQLVEDVVRRYPVTRQITNDKLMWTRKEIGLRGAENNSHVDSWIDTQQRVEPVSYKIPNYFIDRFLIKKTLPNLQILPVEPQLDNSDLGPEYINLMASMEARRAPFDAGYARMTKQEDSPELLALLREVQDMSSLLHLNYFGETISRMLLGATVAYQRADGASDTVESPLHTDSESEGETASAPTSAVPKTRRRVPASVCSMSDGRSFVLVPTSSARGAVMGRNWSVILRSEVERFFFGLRSDHANNLWDRKIIFVPMDKITRATEKYYSMDKNNVFVSDGAQPEELALDILSCMHFSTTFASNSGPIVMLLPNMQELRLKEIFNILELTWSQDTPGVPLAPLCYYIYTAFFNGIVPYQRLKASRNDFISALRCLGLLCIEGGDGSRPLAFSDVGRASEARVSYQHCDWRLRVCGLKDFVVLRDRGSCFLSDWDTTLRLATTQAAIYGDLYTQLMNRVIGDATLMTTNRLVEPFYQIYEAVTRMWANGVWNGVDNLLPGALWLSNSDFDFGRVTPHVAVENYRITLRNYFPWRTLLYGSGYQGWDMIKITAVQYPEDRSISDHYNYKTLKNYFVFRDMVNRSTLFNWNPEEPERTLSFTAIGICNPSVPITRIDPYSGSLIGRDLYFHLEVPMELYDSFISVWWVPGTVHYGCTVMSGYRVVMPPTFLAPDGPLAGQRTIMMRHADRF